MTRLVQADQNGESIPPSPPAPGREAEEVAPWCPRPGKAGLGRRKTVYFSKRRALATMPPGITRSPSIAISAGRKVVAVGVETTTTVIAPTAIVHPACLSAIPTP